MLDIDGLVQEIHNSIANALELRHLAIDMNWCNLSVFVKIASLALCKMHDCRSAIAVIIL